MCLQDSCSAVQQKHDNAILELFSSRAVLHTSFMKHVPQSYEHTIHPRGMSTCTPNTPSGRGGWCCRDCGLASLAWCPPSEPTPEQSQPPGATACWQAPFCSSCLAFCPGHLCPQRMSKQGSGTLQHHFDYACHIMCFVYMVHLRICCACDRHRPNVVHKVCMLELCMSIVGKQMGCILARSSSSVVLICRVAAALHSPAML